MALGVRTNIAALRSINQLKRTQASLSDTMEKISSGLRIRRSADDAAGLAVASRLKSDNISLRQAIRNANDGVSLVQTAEGTLSEIGNMLVRMRELSVQSMSGTYSEIDRKSLRLEFRNCQSEIRRISSNCTYNGISLLAGRTGFITIQVGIDHNAGISANTTNKIGIQLSTISASQGALGISPLTTYIYSFATPRGSIATIDRAIMTVNSARAELGSAQNRLESAISEAMSYSENLSATYSRIMDLDYASESAMMTRFMIMQQAGVAALSQANALPSSVISLLA